MNTALWGRRLLVPDPEGAFHVSTDVDTMDRLLKGTGRLLARHLNKEKHAHGVVPPHDAVQLLDVLKPADVLLVEGHSRISTAIKYFTQFTWSQSALFIGRDHGFPVPDDHPMFKIVANL